MEDLLLDVEGLNRELSFVDSYINEFLYTKEETCAVGQVLASVCHTRGKMIRPTLLLLAARFGPQYETLRQRLCKLGALIEIVHNRKNCLQLF